MPESKAEKKQMTKKGIPTMTKHSAPTRKRGIAAIFMLIGVSGSIRLMVPPSLSSAQVLVLTVAALFGLLVMFFEELIDSFDFRKMKVQLREVEKSRREVEELAVLTVRMAVAARTSAVTWEGCAEADAGFRKTAREILTKAGVAADDPLFGEIDGAAGHKVEVA